MDNSNTYFQSRIIKIQTILICLLPVSLVLSIFIADLIVVILFFSFLYICYKNKNFTYFNNIFFIFFFSYWFYISLLSFFSENFIESFRSSFTYIRFIILPLIILYSIKNDTRFIKYFLKSLIITFTILIFDSFYEFLMGKNILGYGNLEKGRLVSFFKDEYVLGSFISKLFFLIASLWFFIFGSKDFKKNLFFIIFYLASFSIVFLSGDRMPFLLFLFGSLIFILLANLKKKIKFTFIFLSSLIIFLGFSLSESLYDRIVKRTLFDFGSEKGIIGVEGARTYYILTEDKRKITFLAQHQNFLKVSYNIFKENPLFGKGNKGYSFNCNKYRIDHSSCPSHPHNTYLQLLVENGLIGFIFFFTIFLWLSYLLIVQFFKIFFNNNDNKIISNSKLCILICIYLNLWPIAQTGNLFNNWLSIIYFLPVGFLLNESNLKKIKL